MRGGRAGLLKQWEEGEEVFLRFLDNLSCYVFETNLRFIYNIPEKSSSFENSHNIWDCAFYDIIWWLSAVD